MRCALFSACSSSSARRQQQLCRVILVEALEGLEARPLHGLQQQQHRLVMAPVQRGFLRGLHGGDQLFAALSFGPASFFWFNRRR